MTVPANSLDDLASYVEFKKECDGVSLQPDEVMFEEFLGYLDVEHFLGLRGKETWSKEGNETQVIVKTLICQILTEYMRGLICPGSGGTETRCVCFIMPDFRSMCL
jgi:hypothetical protein